MAGDDNMWEAFLHEAKRTDASGEVNPKSTLFIVGDPQNGKSSILKPWKDRTTSDTDIPEYILDFSYCNVIDRYDPDTADDALVSRMSIWQLDDNAHSNLLPTLTKDSKRVGFVITLDLSDPATIMETFDKWLTVYKDTCEGLITGGSDEEKELKLKISTYVQTFVDATKKIEKVEIKIIEQKIEDLGEETAGENKEEEDGNNNEEEEGNNNEEEEGEEEDVNKEEEGDGDPGDNKEEENKEEEDDEIILEAHIDPSIPENNYGIPLFVIGLKADYFEKLNPIGANDKFDFLTNRLRKKCLAWGATLIFTSAAGEGVNASLMVDQIYHRLFDFPLLHRPKLVGSSTDYAIHVPAGYDQISLIDMDKKKWDDNTHLKVVFDQKDQKEVSGRAKAVEATSDLEFFQRLKEQLDSGKPRSDPSMSKSQKKKKKERAVKSFFKNLLAQ